MCKPARQAACYGDVGALLAPATLYHPSGVQVLQSMRLGDQAFFYHSNCKKPGIVGIMQVRHGLTWPQCLPGGWAASVLDLPVGIASWGACGGMHLAVVACAGLGRRGPSLYIVGGRYGNQ